MPEGEIEVAYCHVCGTSMDVTEVAPFTNVECPACGKHTRVKREFGPYTLTRRHAIGGMSVVFIAHDNTLNREVVVKILNEEYGGDDKRIAAFEEEARITASFSHPHVVRVFTTGRAFERFYIAMELVPGGHFEHHIRERGSIPEGEMLPLAIQIVEGLKAAQTAGLIHRDMKPGNILLDSSGNAKIVDFGLALVTKGGKATAAEIWATPYYVPPEAIEGLPEDFRSDMYAFGATIYHALAGKPPCNEESMDTNKLREAKKKIPPLAKAAPWISADTCALVDRTMAHAPAQRFCSYDDLLVALVTARQRLAKGGVAPEPEPAGGSRRNASSNKFALAGASLLVIAALAVSGWWVTRPDEPAATSATTVPGAVSKSAVAAPGDGNGARIGSAYREAGDALKSGDHAKARTLFAEVRDLPGVLEPTGSWAACEAVICSFLDGRPGDAREDSRAAIDHLEKSADLDPEVREVLADALARVRDLRMVKAEAGDSPISGPRVLATLISGLKNWEHGMPQAALPHFQAVLAVEAKGGDAWVGPYQQIAANYASDAETLRKAEPKQLPNTAEACRGLVDELHAVHATLKTKGRARFNLRVWQLELEKHARSLGKPSSPALEPAADVLAEFRNAAAACDFSKAVAMIKAPGFAAKSGGPKASAMLLLAEAADAFLAELEDKLRSPPAGLSLELRDTTKLEPITGSRSGGFTAMDGDGAERGFSWSELSPDSVIELHRMLVKDETSELERLRRHEQAIAFDLLAGDPERGRKAATGLAARYPAFKRRWDLVLPGLE